jgi:hypothetical protein
MLPPLTFPGLPSLHSIIEAIANGFFGALADALVPGFLKHGTVATIQHLVALPDPDTWGHVHQLQGDMTYLAVMLMPVTLAVGTLRYWLVGFTGQAHPVAAVARCSWVTAVLVGYGWIVGQTVAATNTLTHAILGFPTVGNGLQRIIGVLFGGALLAGAGGVFGAFLVIIGVLFAAGLFAAQVLLTVVLALLIVAGPPLIALSAIPELSHLARAWAHALLATALVPLGWTILFATAGALCLDATSFTGGAAGLPGHVAAAFAGLITFVLAVKLPLMLLGELRRLLTATGSARPSGTGSAPSTPGAERIRAAHMRLRSAALEGVPSLGRSVGRAAGAMGAPVGGPLGAAHRGLAGAARRTGIHPTTAAGVSLAGAAAARASTGRREPTGARGRLARAGGILRDAPRDAKTAMTASARAATQASGSPGAVGSYKPGRESGGGNASGRPLRQGGKAAAQRRDSLTPTARPAAGRPRTQQAQGQAQAAATRSPGAQATSAKPKPAVRSEPSGATARRDPGPPAPGAPPSGTDHPGRKVTSAATRDAAKPRQDAVTPPDMRTANAADSPRQPRPVPRVEARTPVSRKPRPRRES